MGWNGSGQGGSTPQKPKVTAKKPSPVRGLIAGAAVVALAIVAYFAFFAGGEKQQAAKPAPKKPAAIKEVTPAKAATNIVAVAQEQKPKRLTKKGTPIPDRVQLDEQGVYRYPNGQRWADPNDLFVVHHRKPRLLFKHDYENEIAVILDLDPTEMDPGLIGQRLPFTKKFAEDFKEHFNDTIVIDKDDTPEEAAMRKAVLETKADLKAAMDRGEDIVKIMNDTQKELDRLCQYHEDLKRLVKEAVDNEELSDKDFEDYVKAANQLLEKQGIKQMAMPKIAYRQARLKLHREWRKNHETQETQETKETK